MGIWSFCASLMWSLVSGNLVILCQPYVEFGKCEFGHSVPALCGV